MTQITIPLNIGINYISFPATSIDDFWSIFTKAGIIKNIVIFKRFNSVLQQFEIVDYTEHIIRGMGYYINVSSKSNISYDGIEYTLLFNELQKMLIQGWNLVGTGINDIEPLNWCKIIDPVTNLQSSLIITKRAYWINFDDCVLTSKASINLWVGILGLAISILYLIGEVKKVENAPGVIR